MWRAARRGSREGAITALRWGRQDQWPTQADEDGQGNRGQGNEEKTQARAEAGRRRKPKREDKRAFRFGHNVGAGARCRQRAPCARPLPARSRRVWGRHGDLPLQPQPPLASLSSLQILIPLSSYSPVQVFRVSSRPCGASDKSTIAPGKQTVLDEGAWGATMALSSEGRPRRR